MGATIQISRLLWTFTILSMVSVVYCFGDRVKGQEFSGDPELLKLVAVQSRVHVESLLTWRGTLNVVENRSEASGEERRYKSNVDFAYDRTLNAKRWRWNCHDFAIIKDGTESPAEVGLMSGMLKDNAFYRLGPVSNSYKGRKAVVIHGENRFAFGPESTDFDPLYCFTSLGEPVHDRFDGLYRLVKTGGAKSWTTMRTGDVILITSNVVLPDGGFVVNHYEVALSKGANIVLYRSSDPYVTMTYEYEFENVSNIWVPISHTYRRIATGSGTSYTREIEWTQNVVNEPSDPALFSIESLGVKDGDRVKDSRSGTDYIIGGK